MKMKRMILLAATSVSLAISCPGQSVTNTMASATHPAFGASHVTAVTEFAGPVGTIRWGDAVLNRPPGWYASARGRAVADTVLQYQTANGSWPKNTDLAAMPPSAEYLQEIRTGDRANTIDNGGTTLPMRFLALMVQATGNAEYRAAFERGFDYLIAAQYPNGGWPQFFPLRDHGYYSHITFNDNAMINVMIVMRDSAAGQPPYHFVDNERRARAAAAVAKGINCILRAQLKQGGKLAAWCAQYDEKTLEPVWARNFEPPSLSGEESVGIIRFLMEIERPTQKEIAAVESAVAWFKTAAIHDVRVETFINADGKRDRRVVVDPAAGLLWARFYDLGTNRPLFTGRDKVLRYTFSEIEYERRNGYDYYGTWPATLLARDYPRWQAKHNLALLPVNGQFEASVQKP
jgi:PelA/Pel-15E family pectate lyase